MAGLVLSSHLATDGYFGFAVVLSSGAAVFGLFMLNRRIGTTAMRLRTKVLAGGFVVASLAMVINVVAQATRMTIIGLLLIAAGIPIFLWSNKRQRSCDSRAAILPETVAVAATE